MTSITENLPVGLLGGSFNPPHVGHLALARTVLDQGLVGRVCLLPTAAPPHKPVPSEADAATRLEMAELLAQEDERLSVSGLELERAGPSYTIDTVRELLATGPQTRYRLVIGSDQAKAFAAWREWRELLRLAPPLIAERPGELFSAGAEIEAEGEAGSEADFPGMAAPEREVMRRGRFNMPPVPVSSSLVRARLAAGAGEEELKQYLTAPVLAFIRRRGLYGTQRREG